LTVVRRGEKPVVHVVWRDISERKRLEAELRQAQRLESVGRLAGGVAHDFNNLLLVILGHSELLESEFESGQPDPKHVAGIRSAADRAVDLTRQLLAFSRGQPVLPRVTDLGVLVDKLGGLLERLIGEHIELALKLQQELLNVFADPSQLEQVVVNLAVNARDAMPSGGRLVISVDRCQISSRGPLGQLTPGDYVRLRVADSGVGMTHEQIDRAFDPFYTTKALGKGTGLGMATVHAIAVQNGGHASIESTPAHGTTVQVLFPLSRRDPVVPEPGPRQNRRTGGGETILLVEDEQAIRDLFESALTAKGYRVLTAADGQEAVDRTAQWGKSIDLLITDVVMPRVSGPELVRRLSMVLTDLKVLYMSGYSGEADLRGMSDGERAGLLEKPFSPMQLEAEIRRILDAD
jgi:nitrogen-specific signal transduction histidine kinase/CheY-like chemotaxis protein